MPGVFDSSIKYHAGMQLDRQLLQRSIELKFTVSFVRKKEKQRLFASQLGTALKAIS